MSLVVLFATACASTPREHRPVVTALCEAASAAQRGDLQGAEEAFARAHDDLHGLARDLQENGPRRTSGELLEAKQVVETAFAADREAEDVAARLDRLIATTATAVGAPADPAATCD